jgi:hypothetical protein
LSAASSPSQGAQFNSIQGPSREGDALTNKESHNKSSLKRKSMKGAVVVERESHQQIHSREKESVSKNGGASVGAHGSSTSGVAHEVKNSAGVSQGMKISSSSSKLILPASSSSQSASSSSTANPSPSKLVLPCDEKSSSPNSPQKTPTVSSQSVNSESVSKNVSWCSVEYGQKDSNSASGGKGSSNTKKDSKKKGKSSKKESGSGESAQQTPSGNCRRDSGHKKLVLPGETPKPQQDLIHSSDGENVTSQAGIAATSLKRSSSFAASSVSSRPTSLATTSSSSSAVAAAASPVSTPKG